MSHYIAITSDDQPIWGIGHTEAEAIADATRYGAGNINAEGHPQYFAALHAIDCTPALYALVARDGAVAWDYDRHDVAAIPRDTVLDLIDDCDDPDLAIMDWCNAIHASRSEDCQDWYVVQGGHGHYLTDDQLQELAHWLLTQ